MNKTELLLLMQHESPAIPLAGICEQYFALTRTTANHRAKAGTLPIPAFRLSDSQKAPWMVHASDLAQYIEDRRAEAKREHVGV